LLLLALCRTSSVSAASLSAQSSAEQDKVNALLPASFIPPTHILTKDVQNDIQRKTGGDSTSVYTALALGAVLEGGKKVPAEVTGNDIINNGILCAYADNNVASVFKDVIYGNVNQVAERRWFQQSFGHDLDCNSNTPVTKCFCKEKNTLIYCLGLKYKETIKRKCRKQAHDELKTLGGKLAKAYDYDKFYKDGNDVSDQKSMQSILKNVDGSVDQIKEFAQDVLCEAIHPQADAKMEALFATEPSYILVEAVILGVVGQAIALENPPAMAQAQAKGNPCMSDEVFKTSEFDKGFTFCLYKTWGKEFEKQKYLTCSANGVATFDDSHKPKASPQFAPISGFGSGSASGSASASGSGSNPASASLLPPYSPSLLLLPPSLLLLPLATAAAVLLRHYNCLNY
ncbi:hypothetical protein PMAYCL1PPCAC_13730, partial [Pristionchus mayeri]